MINDSIVPNGLDGAPGEGGRAAGERANNRLEPSNGPDGAQGSPGTGATGGNNANPFEPTGPVSAVGRLAAASANNANPDGAAAAGGRDNDLGQPDGPVVGRPFELNGPGDGTNNDSRPVAPAPLPSPVIFGNEVRAGNDGGDGAYDDEEGFMPPIYDSEDDDDNTGEAPDEGRLFRLVSDDGSNTAA